MQPIKSLERMFQPLRSTPGACPGVFTELYSDWAAPKVSFVHTQFSWVFVGLNKPTEALKKQTIP
jgi:hypothetical protein